MPQIYNYFIISNKYQMTPEELKAEFDKKMKQINDFVSDDAKDIAGIEAVNHFKQSFDNEGFTDEKLEPWKDVKRRNPQSAWYGHSGQTGKVSELRKTAKILNGETGELKEATTYSKTARGVRITNDKQYAGVHNNGGVSFIYGKKAFNMPARPFIGTSMVLISNIKEEINIEINNILKQ